MLIPILSKKNKNKKSNSHFYPESRNLNLRLWFHSTMTGGMVIMSLYYTIMMVII